MSGREGFIPEEFLGQILVDGSWLDYSRGTEEQAKRWQAEKPESRRVVDWIYKERVIFPATPPPSEVCDHEPNGWDCDRYSGCPGYES